MTIPDEREAEVRRLYYAEHWKVGTIASEIGVHHDAVERVLGLQAKHARARAPMECLLGPYKALVQEHLERHPRLRATRLFDMIEDRGYEGSERAVRRYVATVRPKPAKEAFLSLDPLPGEQAQVDWGHVGSIPVAGGRRALWVFVMVLAYSRAIWAELVLDLSVYSLLRSLSRAVAFFEGAPRTFLFDNPKIVVLERHGAAIRFHPLLLSLCGDLCVSPRLCGVRKPQQKGGVERAIRYLKERFFAARRISSLAGGNDELITFLATKAMSRVHPRLPGRTVASVFSDEKRLLLKLPSPLPSTDQILPVAVDKTAFICFDTNRYSVPPAAVTAETLTLVADDVGLRLLDKGVEVARHERDWGRNRRIEKVEHRAALIAQKRGAAAGKGRDRLRAVVPDIDALLARWVDDGRNVGSLTARTLSLLDLYGAAVVTAAVADVLARGVADVGALALACERLRKDRGQPVPIAMSLADHVQDRDVLPHDLGGYDD
ncbi:MAG: IS21 family transposase [Chloroflexota bacterium]|nr:IS21 family transposase [Chloroflexota bacterium]